MFIPQVLSHERNIFVEFYVQKRNELITERKSFVELKCLLISEETIQCLVITAALSSVFAMNGGKK